MCQELLLQYYRVEFEDFGRLRFLNASDWRSEVENHKRSEKIYQETEAEFAQLVEDLSDGLCIDLSKLETLGKWLWFSRQYRMEFGKIVEW